MSILMNFSTFRKLFICSIDIAFLHILIEPVLMLNSEVILNENESFSIKNANLSHLRIRKANKSLPLTTVFETSEIKNTN